MGKIVNDELEIRRESIIIFDDIDNSSNEISKKTLKKVLKYLLKNPHHLEENYKEKPKGGPTCDTRDCDFFDENDTFNCRLEIAKLGPDCEVYRNKEREASALSWVQAQAKEIIKKHPNLGGIEEESVSTCTRIIAAELDKKNYDWEDVITDCERILGLEGHAENPMSSNLPNAVRDLKADKTPGELKIIHDCTQCSHKNICPILPLYRNSGIAFDLKACAFFNKNT